MNPIIVQRNVVRFASERGMRSRCFADIDGICRRHMAEVAKKVSPKVSTKATAQISINETPAPAAFNSRTIKVDSFNPSDQPLPRLVIVGGGWGSTFLLKNLKPFIFNTTLVSDKNYFLFTPLLPESSSGTLEPNCIVEGFRRICNPSGSYFVEARVKDVDFRSKIIKAVSTAGENIEIPYDFLVMSVGATVNTFGIPGIEEYAIPLKTIEDSIKIREKVLGNFEKAEIADSESEKKHLLTFVVCGAGPTGVECIGELRDLIYDDLIHYFPTLVKNHVTLKLVEAADRILLALGKDTSASCLQNIEGSGINVHLNTMISKVDEKYISCKVKDSLTNEMKNIDIPYGLCIWSGGVGPSPLTKNICEKLYPGKRTRGFIVENNLLLKEFNNVFALGDCATFEGPSLGSLFEKVLAERASTPVTYSLFSSTLKKACNELPHKSIPSSKIKESFKLFDTDKSEKLEQGELQNFFKAMNIRLTTLAPTAQVASQQGEFLGKALSKSMPVCQDGNWSIGTKFIPQFKYNHSGIFAYLGNGKSVLELNNGDYYIGRIVFFISKITYMLKQASYRNSCSVLMEWLKNAFFGRSLSRFK